MGVDYTARLSMGIPVSINDFGEPVGIVFDCGKGHRRKSETDKYCSECGLSFNKEYQFQPTELCNNIAKYIEHAGDSAQEIMLDLREYGSDVEGENIFLLAA